MTILKFIKYFRKVTYLWVLEDRNWTRHTLDSFSNKAGYNEVP